jgi:hypothetical protein
MKQVAEGKSKMKEAKLYSKIRQILKKILCSFPTDKKNKNKNIRPGMFTIVRRPRDKWLWEWTTITTNYFTV